MELPLRAVNKYPFIPLCSVHSQVWTITTDASGANGVFSYGGNGGQNGEEGDGTTVTIRDTSIKTTGDGSGGIMTTGGGVTKAYNLNVTTSGRSSAAIRSDRGGSLNINKSEGYDVIYSGCNNVMEGYVNIDGHKISNTYPVTSSSWLPTQTASTYSINQIDKSYKDFVADLSSRGIDIDNFLVYTNPNSFLADTSKSGREKIRKILFESINFVINMKSSQNVEN